METPLRGLMMGAQPIIGYNYGANLLGRVKETVTYSYIYSAIISVVGILLTIIFADDLIGMFSKHDTEMIAVGSRGVILYLIMSTFMGLHMIAVTYFQSIGDAIRSIALNVMRKVVFYLPVLWLLPLWIGLDGVWLSNAAADLLACLIALVMVHRSLKKKLKT